MSAKRCFTLKIRAGKVDPRSGRQVLDMLDAFEAGHQARLGDGAASRQAALDAAEVAAAEAIHRADLARRSAIAQANVLRAHSVYDGVLKNLRAEGHAPIFMKGENTTALGAAARSLLARDPFEIATWNNVFYLARTIRAEAHRKFGSSIEILRAKRLGFKPETVRELDALDAAYGKSGASGQGRLIAETFDQVQDELADQFIAAGGLMVKRQHYFPNPSFDVTKVRAIGPARFAELVRNRVDRDQMLDFESGERLTEPRFDQLVREAYEAIAAGGAEGPPTAGQVGRKMLANSRAASRFFVWKDAAAWREIADAAGMNSSPFDAMIGHIASMSEDIAQMRILGPNPAATKRFILSMFDREAARLTPAAEPGASAKKATKAARKIEARVARERSMFESLWDEVTGTNRLPIDPELARHGYDTRSVLMAGQLGSAIVSSFTDPALAMMTARFNGIPATRVLTTATREMFRRGSEIEAAQLGLTLDTLAHGLGEADRVIGETIRMGNAAKLGPAVIRLQGLRAWTMRIRQAFAMESFGQAARDAGKRFADLAPEFREGLARYGVGPADWDIIRHAQPYEPRPKAKWIRPLDVAADGSPAARSASEKWAQFVHTEMDYAVIDRDPVTRALLLGQSRPGTWGGEVRRSATMYRSYTATFVMTHFLRSFARGFDGRRLAHGALTFMAMTAMGALSMQAKEMLQGRDPLTLDPTSQTGRQAWVKAMFQGGGLGIFGDILFVDQTRYGNSWAATGTGAVFGAVEAVLGDFLVKNIQAASRGEETHFLGDALFIAGRYMPGSSLWFARTLFQREVVDQLALSIDERTPQRFRAIEARARRDWGQGYFFPPGERAPERPPDFGAVIGQ